MVSIIVGNLRKSDKNSERFLLLKDKLYRKYIVSIRFNKKRKYLRELLYIAIHNHISKPDIYYYNVDFIMYLANELGLEKNVFTKSVKFKYKDLYVKFIKDRDLYITKIYKFNKNMGFSNYAGYLLNYTYEITKNICLTNIIYIVYHEKCVNIIKIIKRNLFNKLYIHDKLCLKDSESFYNY